MGWGPDRLCQISPIPRSPDGDKKWVKKMSGNCAIKGGGAGGVGSLMANAILNFHFDYLNPSLMYKATARLVKMGIPNLNNFTHNRSQFLADAIFLFRIKKVFQKLGRAP